MKRILFVLFFILLLLIPGEAFPAPLPENKYLELVMQYNNDLKALRKEIDARIFSIRAEVAVQRPSLSILADASQWMKYDRGDQYMDLGVSDRLDLSGRYGLQEKELLLGLEILKKNYANSVNETLARASLAYRRAVMAELNMNTIENILKKRRESLLVTQEKFDKELIPMLDVLRARSQVDEGEALFLQARRNYEQQLIEMSAMAGQIAVTPVTEVPSITSIEPSANMEKAWTNRPDVAALLLSQELASVQRSLAAKGLAPFIDISLSLRLGQDYRSPYVEDYREELFVKATLTIPLSDGNKTANNTKSKTLLVEKAQSEINAKRDSLKREVAMVWERWNRGIGLESIRRRQSLRAAQELEIAEMMYREGLASQLDLINAQESDQQSQTDLLSAIQELWFIMAEADRVMGRYIKAVSK